MRKPFSLFIVGNLEFVLAGLTSLRLPHSFAQR